MTVPESYADFYRNGGVKVIRQSHSSIGTADTKITVVTGQAAGRIDVPGVAASTLQVALHAHGPAQFDLGSGRFGGFARSGTWIVAPAAQDCRYEPESKLDLLMIELAPETADLDAIVFGPLHQRLSSDAAVSELAKAIWLESENPSGLGQLWADAALLALHGLLARTRGVAPSKSSKGGLAPWQQRRCIEFISDNLADKVGLPVLATLAGLSPYHFARAFKSSIGVPPHRYQLALRVARAKILLETTHLPITEIAFELGYESSQALARLFRRDVGISPSDYRRSRMT